MWVDIISILLQVAAAGLTFVAVTLILLGIKILRTPHHEYESERQKVLKEIKRAREFNDIFYK